MRAFLIGTLCLVAGCSGGEEPKKEEAAPATMAAGQWETSFEVTSHRSTDKTEPAVAAKVGDKETGPACIAKGEEAKPAPELFAGPGHKCSYKDSYIRGGRISATLSCRREGVAAGDLMMVVDGDYKADSFEGTVTTTTFFPGEGDFQMNRKISGRKVADTCQAAETKAG